MGPWGTLAWVLVLLQSQACLGWVKAHGGILAWVVPVQQGNPSLEPGAEALLAFQDSQGWTCRQDRWRGNR